MADEEVKTTEKKINITVSDEPSVEPVVEQVVSGEALTPIAVVADPDPTAEGVAQSVQEAVNDLTPPPPPVEADEVSPTPEPVVVQQHDSTDTSEIDAELDMAEPSEVHEAPDIELNPDQNSENSELSEEVTPVPEPQHAEAVPQPIHDGNAGEAAKTEVAAPPAPEPEESTVVAPPPIEESTNQAASAAGAMVAGVSASQAAKQKNHTPHRNNRKFAAIATIIVGALLAGLAVYVYISASKNTEKSPATPAATNTAPANETRQVEEVTPATTTDVDTTTEQIEDALDTLDAATELPEDDLSDGALGL